MPPKQAARGRIEQPRVNHTAIKTQLNSKQRRQLAVVLQTIAKEKKRHPA